MLRHASVAVVALVCAMGVAACSGDDASSTSIKSELTEAELLTSSDFGQVLEEEDPSIGFMVNPIDTDGCAPINQDQLRHLARRSAVEFESDWYWEAGEIVYSDSRAAIADAYDSIVEGFLACIDDPSGVPEQPSYTGYAKRVEVPDIGDDAFAIVSGLYNVPTRDDRYLDEDFVGSVYDEGIEEPFCRHLFGIVKHDDRLVIVRLVGRTEVKNLIDSGEFADILDLAVDRLVA